MTAVTGRAHELIDRIHKLEDELAVVIDHDAANRGHSRNGKRRFSSAEEREHKSHKTPLATYIFGCRLAVCLTSPLIYLCFFPLALSDFALTIYQAVCFPIYGIPRVKRSDYFVLDRAKLRYLNLLERFNCLYCSYATGLLAYEKEIVGRTEQHWCPIKHAKPLPSPHSRYRRFLNYGAAQEYRSQIETVRRDFSDLTRPSTKKTQLTLSRKEIS